jgi:hypothetical protein
MERRNIFEKNLETFLKSKFVIESNKCNYIEDEWSQNVNKVLAVADGPVFRNKPTTIAVSVKLLKHL